VVVEDDAHNPDGIGAVRLWLDGVFHSLDTDSPYEFAADDLTAGTHTLMAKARDESGNATDSETITISINDGPTTGNDYTTSYDRGIIVRKEEDTS